MESETISVNNEQDFNMNIEDDLREISEEDMVNTPTENASNVSSKSVTKRPRPQTSKCWSYFTKIGNSEDGKERAACNRCKKVYVVGGRSHGTSNLNKHIDVCPMCDHMDIGQMLVDVDGKMRSRKINQSIFREKQAVAMIKHNYPFAMSEHEGHRDVLLYLNPEVKCVSRNTAKSDVLKVYNREKAKLKEELAKVPGRICLTADLWTACTSEGYLCLTAHYVDDNWQLNCKILSFYHMPPPHSGVELAQKILSLLKEWRIEDKIFSITLDNASANDNMQDRLINALKLQNNLLCDGEFFHVRCCAHVLNLIVQDGLKVVSGALHKIRESVKYVRGTEGRMRTFLECVKTAKLDASSGLRLDMPVRWNSTYLMLESALRYRAAFSHLQVYGNHYMYGLLDEEWSRGEKICEFLEPFYEITNLFSGSTYPTSNLYFTNVWQIQCLLLKYKSCGDPLLRSMATSMMEKFDKYWEEYTLVLSFGVVFDPRLKFDILSWSFSKIDTLTVLEKTNLVKNKLKQLFQEYQNKFSHQATTIGLSSSSFETNYGSQVVRKTKEDLLDEFDLYGGENVESSGKSELELYLSEPKLNRKLHASLDVLEYWKKEKSRYPVLAHMVRDLLSIPITTVASESSFSIGGRILNKYRSSLLPENFEALLCTRNWMQGLKSDEKETLDRLMVQLGDLHVPSSKTSEASNQVIEDV